MKRGEGVADEVFAGRAITRKHKAVELGFFRLEDKHINNSSLSIIFEENIETSAITPETDASMDSSLARVALGCNFLASEDSVEKERYRLLKELNRYMIVIEQIKKLVLKKGAAMVAISLCLLAMEEKAATIEPAKESLLKKRRTTCIYEMERS